MDERLGMGIKISQTFLKFLMNTSQILNICFVMVRIAILVLHTEKAVIMFGNQTSIRVINNAKSTTMETGMRSVIHHAGASANL